MNKKGVLFSVLAAAAVVSAGVFYFSRPAFDADALVKNSERKWFRRNIKSKPIC